MSPATGARNSAVDGLRFLGAASIVYVHLGLPHDGWGLTALPLFMALLVYYGAERSLAERARRLVLPWLIWGLIYGALKVVDAVLAGRPIASEFAPWMLLTGPVLPLWFLPFAFLFLALIQAVPHRWRAPVALGTSLIAVLAVNLVALPVPLNHWCSVWAAGATGFLMRQTGRPSAVALGLAGVFLVLAFVPPLDSYAKQTALAGLALALATWLRGPHVPALTFLGGLSMGLYVSHHGVAALLQRVGGLEGLPLFAAVLAGSCLLTLLLRRVLPQAV
ncbi:MAG: acyltransferase family protein [Pseudomonadota bacterium]